MEFRIFEGNMERLEKKLKHIENKCKKYGNDFTYKKVREEYITKSIEENGTEKTLKYIIIDVEGKAICNDWKLIAKVEHTENGNIIKKCCNDVEVPNKYYYSKSICEHCNSLRYRKDTFIVMNEKTKEFKQVGKSCLCDFTGGLNAEHVAKFYSWFEELAEFEAIPEGYHAKIYIDKMEAMQYIAETIKHFGYTKAERDEEGYYIKNNPTKERAKDYYNVDHGYYDEKMFNDFKERLLKEMEIVSFDHNSNYVKELVKNVLLWIEKQEDTNNYIHNLKVICSLDYVTYENFGLLASVFPVYSKELIKKEEIKKEKEIELISCHVGNVGDRIKLNIVSWKCLASWDTQFGITFLYKLIDKNGNVFTWKASKYIDENIKEMEITGTIKNHNEYKEVKQTELTRCRIKTNN